MSACDPFFYVDGDFPFTPEHHDQAWSDTEALSAPRLDGLTREEVQRYLWRMNTVTLNFTGVTLPFHGGATTGNAFSIVCSGQQPRDRINWRDATGVQLGGGITHPPYTSEILSSAVQVSLGLIHNTTTGLYDLFPAISGRVGKSSHPDWAWGDGFSVDFITEVFTWSYSGPPGGMSGMAIDYFV